ncbi:hypothetical protein [Streptomyces mayteni]
MRRTISTLILLGVSLAAPLTLAASAEAAGSVSQELCLAGGGNPAYVPGGWVCQGGQFNGSPIYDM